MWMLVRQECAIMIDEIYDYSSYIIEIAQAILEHTKGLNAEQVEQMEIVHRRAVDFITEFIEAQERELERFRSYLNHDALTPLSIVIGYTELLLMNASGDLGDPYREAVQQIRDNGYVLRDLVREFHEFVLQFV